ncbi:HMG box transcription factor BBX isoform X15 [Homo sapiens]|uniref:HMG box transcription factor BBX isoform X15 n=2 Tax=Homo sapiens TaxID=9606 RepID=UPI000D0C7704|nr:HMG box transcription factor BBX isoform X15 [Homo sapiens]|eukprot:XP_024309435.1 HMG box transcription factor BBX isoform X14 [Homo sapiens]
MGLHPDTLTVTVMKGSNRNKDHSAEGEGVGKRPKRKCLQWHPLLAKKLLDFSEEEEEEDEEEDIDKVQLLGADGLEQDVGETEDDESPEQRARRPMNAFLLFCKRHRSLVRQEHPRLDNRGATKILADWWAVLDPKEKQKYTDMAKEYKDAFMKANPGYKWCPTTNKPVKSPTPTVNPRKKLWAFPSDSSRDLPSPKKAKTEEMPQLNFGMADPTQMGGLSMLLLAGEHALGTPEVSSGTCRPDVSESPELRQKSPLFQFAEISSSTSHSDASTKQCQTSALFQFAEISSNTSQLGGAEPVKRCGKSALFQLAEENEAQEKETPLIMKGVGMKKAGHLVRVGPVGARSSRRQSQKKTVSLAPQSWMKNLKKNSTASLNIVLLHLTGNVYLSQEKRRRLEMCPQNRLKPAKEVGINGQTSNSSWMPFTLQKSQQQRKNLWWAAKREKQGKPRLHTLSGQQMAGYHQQEVLWMTNQRNNCRGVSLKQLRQTAMTNAHTTPRSGRRGAVLQKCLPCLRSLASLRWLKWQPWKMCTEVRGQLRSPMMDSQKKCRRLLYLFPALTSEAPFHCKTLCFTYYPSLVFTEGC